MVVWIDFSLEYGSMEIPFLNIDEQAELVSKIEKQGYYWGANLVLNNTQFSLEMF